MKQVYHTPAKEWKSCNKWAYSAYILMVLYWVGSGRYEDAIMNLGIALAFDPFDQSVQWQNRPLYQQVWLLVHLALVLAGFFILLYTDLSF